MNVNTRDPNDSTVNMANLKRPPFAPTHRRFTDAECDEIKKRATPYYIKLLSSMPHYAAWGDDPVPWGHYIGSRVVSAYELLVREEGFSLPDAVITYPDCEQSDADRDRILAKPLWRALSNGDLTALDFALRQGADPNEPHPYYGNPPLYPAINGSFEPQQRMAAVTALLRAGAHACGITDEKAELLFLAYCAKDAAVMKVLLEHGADPNSLMAGWTSIYDHAEIDYRFQQYYLEVPVAPSDADVASEHSWLQYLERVALELNNQPPVLLRLLWDHGARPRLPLHERVSGSYEEQQVRASARFQAAVQAARERGKSD